MLTLLRVRRSARLRRRPELNGASRPLRRAGSWQPSFCECKAGALPFFYGHPAASGKGAPCGCGNRSERLDQFAMLPEPQTTNLGVRSSNLFGRAIKQLILRKLFYSHTFCAFPLPYVSPPCRHQKIRALPF
jgi:hypothetical protein